MRKLIVLVTVAAVIGMSPMSNSGSAYAQGKEPQLLSLQQAVDYALKNNLALKNNQLDVQSAQKKVNEILASGLPQVNANGSFMNNVQIPTQVLPNFLKPTLVAANPGSASSIPDIIEAQFGQKFSATGSITASQLIFDGGFLMGVKASREFVNLSRINIHRNEIETKVTVSKAYYQVLLLQTNLQMIDTNLKTVSKAKGDLEKLYQHGLVESTDYDRMRLQFSQLSLQRDKVADFHAVALMVLKMQMGMNVNDSIALIDNLDDLYKKSQVIATEAQADYANRTEYKLLKQQMLLNTYNKKRYQYGYAPTVSAFLTHQQNSFGADFGTLGSTWYPGTYWGLNVSIPVFDGFRKSAQIQQVKIDIRKNENDLKNLERYIDQQVYQSKMAYKRASEQLLIQEQNMKLAQDIANRVTLKYNNGLGSSLEYTSAQSELENARNSYLTTVYEYFIAQIELRKALGEIK